MKINKTLKKILILFFLITLIVIIIVLSSSCQIINEDDIYDKLLPNIELFIVHLFSTIILICAMLFFIWKPMNKYLNAKKKYISKELNETELAKKIALKKLIDIEKQRFETYQNSQKIIENAIAESNVEYNKIINNAKEEAKHIVQSSKKDIETLKFNIENEENKKILELSIKIAEELMKKKINKKDSQNFVDEFIESFNKKRSEE